MCGRYAQEMLDREYVQHMREIAGNIPPLKPRYNIAPSQSAPIVRVVDGERTWDELKWGLYESWFEKIQRGPQINARAETVFTNGLFKRSALNRRCLVLATAWYEWKKATRSAPKQPFAFKRKDGGPIFFAGIWSQTSKDDNEGNFAIITTEPNALAETVHNRMPAILGEKSFNAWLDPENKDGAKLQKLLGPYKGKDLKAYPVGTYVNSPKNIGDRCLESIA